MIKISNTRTLHTVENESEYLALRGEVQFSDERIVSFSGQFKKLAKEGEVTDGTMMGEYYGDFYYSENETGNTVNKSINSIPSEMHVHGCDLMEATVAELHEYVKPEADV